MHQHKHKTDKEQGFALLYVLIGLIIASIIMVPFLRAADQQRTAQNLSLKDSIPSTLKEAITKYAMKNGHYPAPANPANPTDDVDYGRPVPVAMFPANCTNSTAPVFNVKCVPGKHTGIQTSVLIGTIPTAALGLDPDQSLDQYGRKLTYAVTKALTESTFAPGPNQWNDTLGGIEIEDNHGNPHEAFEGEEDRIHYVIINHGENGAGAYLERPPSPLSLRANCPNNKAVESENCNDDAVFIATYELEQDTGNENKKAVGLTPILAEGNDYFDDGISIATTLYDENWVQLSENDVYFTAGKAGGSLVVDPIFAKNPPARLYVNGNAIIDAVHTQKLCNHNGYDPYNDTRNNTPNKCYNVADITSENFNAPVKCPSETRGLKSVNALFAGTNSYKDGSAKAECDPVTVAPLDTFTSDCINQGGARGINTEGQLICNVN